MPDDNHEEDAMEQERGGGEQDSRERGAEEEDIVEQERGGGEQDSRERGGEDIVEQERGGGDTLEQERGENTEGRVVVRKVGVVQAVFRGLLWPFRLVVRVYHGVCVFLGFRSPKKAVIVVAATPGRHSLSCRKRLHRATRLMLGVLPYWLQASMGYPVSSSIGHSLSPEVSISPTKLNGKGSKRKQDELDEDEEEEEPQSWVEVLSQELKDEGSDVDPDYEPSTMETESEEYCAHNDTESEIEASEKGEQAVLEENVTEDPEESPPAVQ